jgi:alkylated DNA repair dioxygenase AlkB
MPFPGLGFDAALEFSVVNRLCGSPTLFPIDVEERDLPAIPGLRYLPAYITEAAERELVAAIDAEPWDTSWDRRRQPYGAAYGRDDGLRTAIPDWGQSLAARMFAEGLSERPFDQMLINEYLPGQGIALHRDYEPFDRTVVSLSLLATCVMDFRHAQDERRASLLLEPRSLLVLGDEARYDWQHGIARRKNDRWQGRVVPRSRRLSVTFRLLKRSGAPR